MDNYVNHMEKSCKIFVIVIPQYSSKILLPLFVKNQQLIQKFANFKKWREFCT